MGKIGTFAVDGSIEVEVTECAVSGRPVLGKHSVMEQVGTWHFVRYLSHKAHHITEDDRAAWLLESGEANEKVLPPAEEQAAELTPRKKVKPEQTETGEA